MSANTLAFITFIITSAGPHHGVSFVTTQPLECVRDGEAIAQEFLRLGHEVDVFCDYTSAPVTSPRPVSRKAL